MLLVALFVPLAMNAQTKGVLPKVAQKGGSTMNPQQSLTLMNDFSSIERVSLRELYPTTHSNEYDNNRDLRDPGDYELVTASQTDWSGEYVIAYRASSTSAEVLTGKSSLGNYGDHTSATISNNLLSASDVDSYKVTITKVSSTSNYYYIKQGDYYLGYNSTANSGSNYLHFSTSNTTNPTRWQWTITYSGSTLTINNVNKTARKIQYNTSTPRFACYTTTQANISLFKKIESSCAKPEGLTVDEESVTTNAATVTWTAGDATLWNLRYKKIDASTWTTVTGLTSATFTFSTLDDGDAYEVQVQANCGNNELSAWTASVEIYTYCDVKSLPFFCGFETAAEYGCFLPYNTSDASGISNSSYRTGQYCWRFTGNGDTQYLLSPDFDGTTNMEMSFYYRIRSTTYPQYFMVGYATEDGMTWGDVVTATNTAYTEYTDVFPRGTQYVVIAYQAEENSNSYLSLDDFNFTEATGCYAPNGLTASNVAPHSADLSWGDFTDSYNLRYRTAAGTETFFFDDFEDESLNNWQWTTYTNGDAFSGFGWFDYNPTSLSSSFPSAHSGNMCALASSYDGQNSLTADNYLVTPQVALKGTLKFWITSNYSDTYEVLLSTTGNAVSDFTVTLQGLSAAPSSWTEVSIDLSSYNGAPGYIAIHHSMYDGFFIFLDDFGIYGADIPAGNWVTVNNVTNPYTLPGLDPDTEYEWQVQSICNNGTSDWSASDTFTTGSLCDAPLGLNATDITATSATLNWAESTEAYNVRYAPVSFFDSFENGIGDWITIRNGEGTTGTDWHVVESENVFSNEAIPAHTGTYVMMTRSYASTAYSVDNWLISPEVTLDGYLKFWVMDDGGYHEHFDVYVSTTGTNISDFSLFAEPGNASAVWTEVSVDLSSFNGAQGYIAIRHTDNDQDFLFLDDFGIYTSDWETSSATTNTLPINNLELSTDYVWQVQGVDCDGDGSTTEWSSIASFTTLDTPDVPVESIVVNPNETEMNVGATYTILYTVLPAEATITAVTFSSNDETIATVDENGNVTGVAAGTAIITIAATDGSGVTGTFTVTVMNIDVEEITASDITMMSGETATISYTVLPANATDASVTFTSANTAIATVDADGVVTGVGVGETTITIASVQNPEVTTEITVTVTSDPNAVQFTVNAPANAAPGDVITVEGVLTAPTSGNYGGFNGLLMGIYYDHNAFQFVSGSITRGPVAIQATQIDENTMIQTYTNVEDVIQMAIVVPTENTFVTAEGVVFSVQFTVLAETEGSFTFTARPTENIQFNHETELIAYEFTPSTVEVGKAYPLTIIGYDGSEYPNYYLIASPIGTVAPADVTNMLSNSYDLYYFDPAQTYEWINYNPNTSGEGNASTNSGFNLVAGKGYLYANSETVTLTFIGSAITDETVEVTLTKVDPDDPNANPGLQFPDWNLVGNPFAENNAWLMDSDNNVRSCYTLDTYGNYRAATDGVINPMQGVFVVANTNGETLTFTKVDPEIESKNLVLNLSNGQHFVDCAIVRFDGGDQLPKLQFRQGSTKVYIPMDDRDYAVVSCEEMGEMPVNFKAENNGSYTLSMNSVNVGFAYLHLIDNMTGADVDLLETPSYSFEARTTDYESRFKLVFATGDNSNSDNFAFFSNGSFVINNDGAATLQVIDVTGRILSSESINGCANVNVNAAAGVYMLRLINGDSVKVQKVVVK